MCMENKKNLSVNEIFRVYGEAYRENHPDLLVHIKKVMRAIELCRTEALGGRRESCDSCGFTQILYNSCRNRHCPQCQMMKKEKWVLEKKKDVLPFQYFHVVFTLPHELNPIVIRNQSAIYNLMFKKVKETLLSVALDKKYFGAEIGFFSILHTWGQKLNLHPHLHCAVPGGGYVLNKDKWKQCSKDFFLPVDVLKPKFQYNLLMALKELYKAGKLYLEGTEFKYKWQFQKLVDTLFAKEWTVYIKESFSDESKVIEYLGRYTHRIAISNNRIKKIENGCVYFSYRDYEDNNKVKILKLDVHEFIRRFLLHVVPYRFVRIRYYGLLSHRMKAEKIKNCREYYEIKYEENQTDYDWADIYFMVIGKDPRKCPACKQGRLIVTEVLRTHLYRAPPGKVA